MGAAAAIVGAGIGIQAYGQYRGLRASSVEAKYRAQIDRTNAEIRKQQARDVRAIGARAAVQLERETVQFGANQVTQFASGGIDISSAVVTQAIEETARTGAADIITLQHNIEREIWGIEAGITELETSAAFREAEAEAVEDITPISVAGTLFTGFGSLAARRRNPLALTTVGGNA
jgi:hypothetical protein